MLTVQQALADGSYIPLEKLFLIAREDFHAFEYAHAWSFVYFLNSAKPEYEKAFKKFFKDFYTIAKGVSFSLRAGGGNKYGSWKEVPPQEVRRLLLDKLGLKDVVALEDEWKTYIQAIQIDAPQARFKRAVQALLYLADVDSFPRAFEDVEAAIAGGVVDPQAFWVRGTLHLILKGARAKATEDYRKAVELAPLDAGYRANLAQILAGFSLRTPGLVVESGDDEKLSGSDDALSEAETMLGLACALEPDNEFLRTNREHFLDLLQKKSGTK